MPDVGTKPAECPECGSPDPRMTALAMTINERPVLVSGFGNPTCVDEWHDGHRPWIDGSEWLAVERARRDHARPDGRNG